MKYWCLTSKKQLTKQVTVEKKLNILNRDLISIEHRIIEYKKIKHDLREQIENLKNEEVEITKFYSKKTHWE